MNAVTIAVAAQRLVNAAERMQESLPIYSESSAAWQRQQELRAAITAARQVLEKK